MEKDHDTDAKPQQFKRKKDLQNTHGKRDETKRNEKRKDLLRQGFVSPMKTSTSNVHACTKWSQSGRKKRNITAHVWSSSTSTIVCHTNPPGHTVQIKDSHPLCSCTPVPPQPERDRLTPVHQSVVDKFPCRQMSTTSPKHSTGRTPQTTIFD